MLTAFGFANFSASTGLSLVGSASITADNRLRLTPAVSSQGGAWYTAEKAIVAGSFETTFQFKMATASGGSNGSDGFAFVIQNSSPTELRSGGGGLGYDGMPNSVAVEFDTWLNNGAGDPYNDPSQSHVSVHTNGTGANGANESFRVGSAYNTSGFILDNAQVHTARLSYTPGTLRVFLDNLSTPILTVALDLGTTLGLDQGRAWVGFTAASGGTPMNQDILSWSFSGDDNVVVASSASVIEGGASTTTPLTFTLDRQGSLAGSVTVNWATANGTAMAGSDYVAASGQVVFQDGEAQKTVQVAVNGDNTSEPHETFRLNLSTTATGYSAAGALATILNDDVSVSVGDATAMEGGQAYRFTDTFVSADAYGLAAGRDLRVGPDGNVYVASHDSDEVKVFEGGSGRFLRDLSTPGGELDGPWAMCFGSDGRLYVSGRFSHNVVRFDIGSGEYDVFAASDSGGLAIPWGIAFGPDGDLYASSHVEGSINTEDCIKRFSGATGAFLGDFVAAGAGGLNGVAGVGFGPDGSLYVANRTSGGVSRYNGQTGAYLGAFVPVGSGGLVSPTRLLFHTDGYLYVSDPSAASIFRYNATTGAFADVFAANVSPSATGMAFSPSGEFYMSQGAGMLQAGSVVGRLVPASVAAFTISLNAPSASPVSVAFTTADATALAGVDYVAASGEVTFAPGETTRTILIATVNDGGAEPAETFTVNLSSPVGGVIADGQGVGTIQDDDATKFYVVDDASTDRTYEYGALGASVESYAINSGNTAPRGAASTIAGDKVWVVDANKKVYVYGTGGALLGSWSARGLPSNAAVEGITVYGNDVWIVDGKSDKVFKYAGAASLMSGSQNASSSFSLYTSQNNPNTDAKDIVTDGTAFWVVDDNASGKVAKIPKVFKYSMSGALLGAWSIGTPITSPTGITLDPAGGDAIWILDRGTRRVYQFDHGRSGSGTLTASFALAAGNTNPQGIADPPAAATARSDARPALVRGAAHPRSIRSAAIGRRAHVARPLAARSAARAFPAVAGRMRGPAPWRGGS